MNRLGVWVAVAVVFFSSAAFGVQEYYSVSRSIRALGMGGAFYGCSDDESALFYNPAGLALYRGGNQLMVSTEAQISSGGESAVQTLLDLEQSKGVSSMVSSLEGLQGTPVYGGLNVFPYYVHKYFAMGLLVDDLKADMSFLGRDAESTLDLTAISDSGLFMGFAVPVSSHLFVGANVKALYRAGGHKEFSLVDIVNSSNASLQNLGGAGAGVDADIGVQTQWEKTTGVNGGLGASINNLAASTFPLFRVDGAPPGLVRMASVGGYLELPGNHVYNYLRFLLDLSEFSLGGESDPDLGARDGSFFKHVDLGAEMPLNGWIFVRAGLHQGDYTFGLGLNLNYLKLDFATYGEELDSGVGRLSSRRYMLRLAFGFGAPSVAHRKS